MDKKIIRITENDIVKIVKRVINEAGGYDDASVMASHAGSTQGMLRTMIIQIVSIIDATKNAFEHDLNKMDLMDGITRVTDVLFKIKHTIRDFMPEIMSDDVKKAAASFYREVKKAESKLRMLSNQSKSFYRYDMPPSLTGVGFSMNKEDFNDKLTEILLDLGNEAEKLKFHVDDEDNRIMRRLRKFG